ncbi:MAG: peptidylprolyl isomerase [Crocinitomicaceae bacterium]|nr:peptidylprolyl isomerase [Crocinitomicaceae bacterium]|tara:strand:- start:842 stop:1522 length:681 start_codon:yes stop_codon:yes gene_type:complete
MKKNFIIAIVIAFWSCNNDSTKSETNQFKLKSNNDSLSYVIGSNVIQGLSQQFPEIKPDAFGQAMKDYLNDDVKMRISDSLGNALLDRYQNENISKMELSIKEGKEFLNENGKRKGVITTESGLQYEIINNGSGPKPIATDNVKTHYHGTLIDGTVFDSSVERGNPISFDVNGVIAGWAEALQLMTVGSKWKLYIPYNLAYGERGSGPKIGPYSTLIFEVELLEIN